MDLDRLQSDSPADPQCDDKALSVFLHQEARMLGMALGCDKAIARAALIALMGPQHIDRALRVLGSSDPAFRGGLGPHDSGRLSGLDELAEMVKAAQERVHRNA